MARTFGKYGAFGEFVAGMVQNQSSGGRESKRLSKNGVVDLGCSSCGLGKARGAGRSVWAARSGAAAKLRGVRMGWTDERGTAGFERRPRRS
jgi:hypothetical protein